MNAAVSPQTLDTFFASAPIVLLLIIVAAVYFSTRNRGGAVPIGQTFACASCGRRGKRDHMVAQTHAGAVSWSCTRCAGN